jgi:hypothetical protein
MGAWDVGNFDNDDASSWLGKLADMTAVWQALMAATTLAERGVRIETRASCQALAAAEVVAACCGFAPRDAPKRVVAFANTQRCDPKLLHVAQAAVRAVVSGSSLKELWEEVDDSEKEAWHAIVQDLLDRLDRAQQALVVE